MTPPLSPRLLPSLLSFLSAPPSPLDRHRSATTCRLMLLLHNSPSLRPLPSHPLFRSYDEALTLVLKRAVNRSELGGLRGRELARALFGAGLIRSWGHRTRDFDAAFFNALNFVSSSAPAYIDEVEHADVPFMLSDAFTRVPQNKNTTAFLTAVAKALPRLLSLPPPPAHHPPLAPTVPSWETSFGCYFSAVSRLRVPPEPDSEFALDLLMPFSKHDVGVKALDAAEPRDVANLCRAFAKIGLQNGKVVRWLNDHAEE
ncbi:hypothetical protein TeGR_g10143 [Tetraparma gracilis]|uniref:Uncharacterized protein n=1 Tax=Tetraparma gracilis TaxID=2962635 RepID=A0ABQ6MM60_9STRA|nr:hypothetical protein TeGR_g10143 [Tetraparma gracilis]